jgi:hypothetical protein
VILQYSNCSLRGKGSGDKGYSKITTYTTQ